MLAVSMGCAMQALAVWLHLVAEPFWMTGLLACVPSDIVDLLPYLQDHASPALEPV
jgi:hypothetical protein